MTKACGRGRALRQIGENIWLLRYPLRLFGLPIGRNVTVIRLRDGRLVLHSTAPFTREDVAVIESLGRPAWLLDATLFHDSFAEEGRRAFSGLPYFAPAGSAFDLAATEWGSELRVLRLAGVKVDEHVFFHPSSRTLVVCDLLFNFGTSRSWPVRWFARNVMRLRDGIGVSGFFRMMIRDREAFRRSLGEMRRWDFDRIIVGHGDPIASGGKRLMAEHLGRAGFLL